MPEPKSLRTIFLEALDIADARRRADYLARVCGTDAALRRNVEELIAAEAESGNFLAVAKDRPDDAGGPGVPPSGGLVEPAGAGTSNPASLSEQPGDRIGRYKLLQKIGEGGCGVVYMAEQEEPVRRRVALKVIKLGMDTRSVIARFEAERQALALMDHPNIAKVFDAGATGAAQDEISNQKSEIPRGRPYFVMELVKGVRITEYCDHNHLSTRARLDLFMQVCRAIQHAHQKGIIHRDIKPSNILVTLHDGVPVPKVIDFGIAKATDRRLTDKTVFTEFRAFIGTPAYMSPEQAEMSGLDIDTRSDLYALGVLLYELLTGKTPFDARQLLEAGLDEMRRIIREVEPARPSTRLTTLTNEELATVSRHRQAEPAKLTNLLRGDLDWIVMKCLEKDRTRRYDTANGLASDIAHHLNNEPVSAAAPSALYLLGKFVRRHRVALSVTSVIVAAVAVAGGAAKVSRDALRREKAERHALQSGGTNAIFNMAQAGNIEAVRQLLQANPALARERDAGGQSPLHWAAYDGRDEVVRLLVAHGSEVDATNHSGATPLNAAAERGKAAAVSVLLELGAQVNHRNSAGMTPLHGAAAIGETNTGRLLLDRGAEVNAVSSVSRVTPLHQAALVGQDGFCELLLERGAQVNAVDANDELPLHDVAMRVTEAEVFAQMAGYFQQMNFPAAASWGTNTLAKLVTNALAIARQSGRFTLGQGHRRIAELLLSRNASVNAEDRWGCTPLIIAGLRDNRAVAEVLIAHNARMDAQDRNGLTALNRAALEGHTNVMTLLLQKGANPNLADGEGFTPLYSAVEHGQQAAAELLLAHGARAGLALPSGGTPLHAAAARGDLAVMGLLLDHGAPIRALDNRSGTPLHWAVKGGRKEAAEWLLAHGASVEDGALGNPSKPLHCAALMGHPLIAALLLDHGASVNAESGAGSPLLLAALGLRGATNSYGELKQSPYIRFGSDADYLAVVKLLLARGAQVDSRRNGDSRTPLFIAISAQFLPAVEVLLAAGANVSQRDAYGHTPLHWTVELSVENPRASNIVQLLLGAQADPNAKADKDLTPLHLAAARSQVAIASLLLRNGARVNERDAYLATPLHHAVDAGSREMVELLLASGADPNLPDRAGGTALNRAVFQRSPKALVDLLLSHDARVNTVTTNGATPLIGAAMHGDTNLMQHFLARGAAVDEGGEDGVSALMVAAVFGQQDAARLLLNHGAKLNGRDRNDISPLTYAAKSGRQKMVEFLLDRGADIRAKNKHGFSALHEAADRGHPEVVELLLARGAEVDARDEYDSTPLHCAAQADFTNQVQYAAVVKVLLAHHADVNARMRGDQTPLHRAAETGHARALEALLAAKPDLNARARFGNTPLHLAARNGHRKPAELLSQHGADPSLHNESGLTPAEVAKLAGHEDLWQLLQFPKPAAAGAAPQLTTEKNNTPPTP